MSRRGKLIVLYGVNNLGKSTQAKMLVEKLRLSRKRAEYIKYAIYNLEPSGSVINGYLRHGNPYNLTPMEFQMIQVLNRTQYQPILEQKLKRGIHIVAEDYRGTGIAWGIGNGGHPELLKKMNSHLTKEDIVFLFVGKRFGTGQEKNHRHEQDTALTNRVARVHIELAREYGWIPVDANRPRSVITDEIWQKVQKII